MSTSPTLEKEETIGQSSKLWANQTLLSKPLYVYQLPTELLQSLHLRSIDVQESEQLQAPAANEEINQQQVSNNGKITFSSGSCSICPKSPHWDGLRQARAHVRSDWHRYNSALAKKSRSEDCLDEDAFHQLVDDLSSEASSSEDSETEGKERAPVDHVAALLKKLKVSSNGKAEVDSEEDDERSAQSGMTAKEPYLWFVTPSTGDTHIPQTQFGILRAQFPDSDGAILPKDWHISTLKKMQTGALQEQQIPKIIKRFKGSSAANEAASALAAVFVDASGEKPDESDSSEEESGGEGSVDEAATVTTSTSISSNNKIPTSPMRTWTIILMGGGNFSAVTIALNPRYQVVSKKKGTSEVQYLVLARKQIHRYTTRRKQGGAQSAQDASGKFAKSAGAQLRRYGEQALGEEIRALLLTKSWRDCIRNSDKVWIRAGLKSARGILWNWVGSQESPLDAMRKEDKVQSLPIATRKPTVGECLRCFAELTKVRVRHYTEEELQARDDMYRAQLENSARAKQERRLQEKEKLRREAEAKEAALVAKKKAAASKLDEKEILKRERFTRLIDMIRKGRIENTINHLEKYEAELLKPSGWDSEANNGSDPDDVDDAMEESRRRVNLVLPFWWRYQDAREKGALLSGQEELTGGKAQLVPSTLLQIAAEGGHANQVSYFLIERRSDPTIPILPPPLIDATNDDSSVITRFPHRTAYDLCNTRDARDVFRRLMASQPDWCLNWSGMEIGGARVAKALTSEMEEAREKEEKVRDKRQATKEKARQRQQEDEVKKAHEIDLAQIKAAAAPPPSSTSKNRLGGSGTTAPRALQKERDEAAGLTPEVRARIEREKRARAAEARFKSLQGGS